MADEREDTAPEEQEDSAPETEQEDQVEGDEIDQEDEADDDDADDQASEDDQEEEERPRERRKSANDTIRELRQRAQKAERELAQRTRAAPVDPAAQERQRAEEARQEQAVLDTMDPVAISKFYSDKAKRELQGQLNGISIAVGDQRDAAAWDRACAKNPVFADIADEVEERLEQYRAQGGNPQRLFVARLILGERVEKRATRAKGKQQRRAERDRDRERARPMGGRSDATRRSERGNANSQQARAKRLDEGGQL